MECVEKIIKKDWSHPLTGEKLKEQDIIPLQRVITFVMTMSIIYSCIVMLSVSVFIVV
jgi:nitric oxide synthase-interacting protein